MRKAAAQSAAVHTGITGVKRAWIVTLDADGQNDPADHTAPCGHCPSARREQAADRRLFAERRDTVGEGVSPRRHRQRGAQRMLKDFDAIRVRA